APAKKEFSFSAHDTNADGRVNKEEAEKAYAPSFGEMDKDGDGYLSRIEVGPGKKVDELDTDKDEKIRLIEFMRGFDSRFSEADEDKVGHVDRDEAVKFGIPK